MTQSAIPAQELVKRLCDDRKIRDTSPFDDRKRISAKLHGWELDLEDAA